jgi:copper(I)-binding protein
MLRVALRLVIGVVALLGMLVAGGPAAAQQKPDLSATKGVVRAPAAGQTDAVVTAVIQNTTAYIVYLTTGSSDAASGVELRDGSKGTPTAVKYLTVQAYGSLTMDPKGMHLALTGLKRPLKAGENVKITLTTDQGATVDVAAVVQ